MYKWILILYVDSSWESNNMFGNEYHISFDIANSIEQAIKMSVEKEYLLLIVISNDIQPMQELNRMRDVVKIPMIVISQGYSNVEKLAATRAGAIAYLGDITLDKAIAVLLFFIYQLHEPRLYAIEPLRVCTYRNILLSDQCHLVFVAGERIRLTNKEFKILSLLMNNAGRVLSYEQIYKYVWQREDIEQARKNVCNLVSRLKQSLDTKVSKQDFITAVWEIGYKIDIC